MNELERAHIDSSSHRALVERSRVCGCFYCCEVFPPSEVREWIDEGETALCPRCGIDAVLPDSVGFTDEFLKAMRGYWF
jgi:NAD-dependent SIR2 family protein deacetylase